jgi:hypothetical protein
VDNHESTIDPAIDEKNGLAGNRWLNRNVFLFGLTSLLSDFCHEMATAVLPQFMQAIGASAAALGFISCMGLWLCRHRRPCWDSPHGLQPLLLDA